VIRLTWRQFRTQGAVFLGALVAAAVVAGVTGPDLVHLYETTVATCGAHGDCSDATTAFLRSDTVLRTWLGILVIVVPGIIGIFWGAPLVAREIEAGTFRLAWTQSVTRTRWVTVKLCVIGLAAMAAAGLLSLTVTWWASPLDRVGMNLFGLFDQRGIVPVGYAAFGLALGVTAGVLIRRTLPAMAATLVVFVAARLAFVHLLRPHLLAPTVKDFALDPTTMGYVSMNGGPSNLVTNSPNIPNAWIYSDQIVDRAGHLLSPQFVARACPLLGQGGPGPGGPGPGGGSSRIQASAGAQQALENCVVKVGARFHELVRYQPSSHYWALQSYELAFFLGAAVLLGGFSLWWVRNRLS